MHIESEFLTHIRDNPDDDAPRLIFADWLDEQGQSERAEFIRVQCKLADVRKHCQCAACATSCGREQYRHFCQTNRREFRKIRQRERDLLDTASVQNWAEMPEVITEWRFGRGFVEQISCPVSIWVGFGPSLIIRHPITHMTPTDVVISAMSQPVFVAINRSLVPEPFWLILLEHENTQDIADALIYPTEGEARAAASAAMIAWAKRWSAIEARRAGRLPSSLFTANQPSLDLRYFAPTNLAMQ